MCSQLEVAKVQLAQTGHSKKRPYQRHAGPVHETVNVVLELHQNLVGVSESDIMSQIRRQLRAPRDNIGKHIDTAYDEHKLCASSENDGTILQYTDDDRANDRVKGFREIGSYEIVVV